MVFLSRVPQPLLGMGVFNGLFFGLAQTGGRREGGGKGGEGGKEEEDEGEEQEEEEEGLEGV